MKYNLAPVVIFCYKRLDLLKKLLRSLEKNQNSKKITVFFFLDNFKNEKDKKNVIEVHSFIQKYKFFNNKKIIIRKKNYGLKKNISDGIKYVFKKYNKIIVLEDDLEISKNFLAVMNTLLNKHENVKNISTITGYSFSNIKFRKLKIKENFFLLKRPSSWGWATWRSKWQKIQKVDISLEPSFKDYGNDLTLMSIKKKKKLLNSWAYDWTLKHLKSKQFCMYPKFTMVKNNGFDEYATNNFFKTKKFLTKIKFIKIKNYSYKQENNYIKNLSKLNYDSNVFLFLFKFIFFKLFYAKTRKNK